MKRKHLKHPLLSTSIIVVSTKCVLSTTYITKYTFIPVNFGTDENSQPNTSKQFTYDIIIISACGCTEILVLGPLVAVEKERSES